MNSGGEQGRLQQQQQQQQQQLFLSPQAENLTHLYSLVEKLITQLNENKLQKQKIVHSIDTLSNKLSRDPEKRRDGYRRDMVIIDKFLQRKHQSNGRSNSIEFSEDLAAEERDLEELRLQNKKLLELLDKSKKKTGEMFQLLKYHEDAFNEVVKALRQDIVRYRSSLLRLVKGKFESELIPLTDAEFNAYIRNIENYNLLLDISEIYRLLAGVLDQ